MPGVSPGQMLHLPYKANCWGPKDHIAEVNSKQISGEPSALLPLEEISCKYSSSALSFLRQESKYFEVHIASLPNYSGKGTLYSEIRRAALALHCSSNSSTTSAVSLTFFVDCYRYENHGDFWH